MGFITLPKIDERASWSEQISWITRDFVSDTIEEHPSYSNTIAVIRRAIPYLTAFNMVQSSIQTRYVNNALPYFRLMVHLFDETKDVIDAAQEYKELSPYTSYLIEMLRQEKEFGISFFKKFHRHNYTIVYKGVEYSQL